MSRITITDAEQQVEVHVGYDEMAGAGGFFLQVWQLDDTTGEGNQDHELLAAGMTNPIGTLHELLEIAGPYRQALDHQVVNLLHEHRATRDRTTEVQL